MSQNSNKLSSFIGIILLIAVIVFTVFINFSVEKPIEEIEIEEEETIFEEKKTIVDFDFEFFDSMDIVNFWQLENIHTIYTSVGSAEEEAHIQFYKISKDNFLNTTALVQEVQSFQKDKTIHYGSLKLKNSMLSNEDKNLKFTDFEVNDTSTDSVKLNEIGNLFIDYQINSVITKPKYGNFTCIYFKDGRRVILTKENANILDKYYNKLIENAIYINDSTKIAYPSIVQKN